MTGPAPTVSPASSPSSAVAGSSSRRRTWGGAGRAGWAQAALFQNDNNGSYGTVTLGACPVVGAANASVFGNTTIENAVASAKTDGGGVGAAATCVSDGTSYAAQVSRPQPGDSAYWCVDSSGTSCAMNAAATTTSCACI